MRILNFIFVFVFVACVVKGQDKVNIEVPFTDIEPTIDGYDEEAWDQVPAVPIENVFQAEEPTVTAYWKALWDNTALYVFISVEDDDHWPSWVSGGSWFQYDQPEVYLDINAILNDGFGAGANQGTGHYQVQPGFSNGGSGVVGDLGLSNYRPGGKYCYMVDGENYIFEYALDYTSFVNKDNVTMSVEAFQALDSIGFDVYIIDQDEGVTTERQRAVWQNVGAIDENYNNMDDAGTITLVDHLTNNVESKSHTLSVYPNPVLDYLTINAEFDKLIITNILGEEIETIVNSDNRINMKSFAKGIYLIQAFNKWNLLGVTKIHKI